VARRGRFRRAGAAIGRAAGKVKSGIKTVRSKLSTGGAKMTTGQIAFAAIGAGGGAAAAEAIHQSTGWSRPVSGGLVSAAGTLGLVALPDGKPQAVAAGLALGGTAYTVASLVKGAWEKKEQAKQAESDAKALPVAADKPKQLPAGNAAPPSYDVQGAFDAARAINGYRRAHEERERTPYWDPYGYAE
jgi:hypothetical protein